MTSAALSAEDSPCESCGGELCTDSHHHTIACVDCGTIPASQGTYALQPPSIYDSSCACGFRRSFEPDRRGEKRLMRMVGGILGRVGLDGDMGRLERVRNIVRRIGDMYGRGVRNERAAAAAGAVVMVVAGQETGLNFWDVCDGRVGVETRTVVKEYGRIVRRLGVKCGQMVGARGLLPRFVKIVAGEMGILQGETGERLGKFANSILEILENREGVEGLKPARIALACAVVALEVQEKVPRVKGWEIGQRFGVSAIALEDQVKKIRRLLVDEVKKIMPWVGVTKHNVADYAGLCLDMVPKNVKSTESPPKCFMDDARAKKRRRELITCIQATLEGKRKFREAQESYSAEKDSLLEAREEQEEGSEARTIKKLLQMGAPVREILSGQYESIAEKYRDVQASDDDADEEMKTVLRTPRELVACAATLIAIASQKRIYRRELKGKSSGGAHGGSSSTSGYVESLECQEATEKSVSWVSSLNRGGLVGPKRPTRKINIAALRMLEAVSKRSTATGSELCTAGAVSWSKQLELQIARRKRKNRTKSL